MERTIKVLNEMKRDGVIEEYAVGGAMAALFYIEPIETQDLDVFTLLPESDAAVLSLDGIYRYLTDRGYLPDGGHVVIEGVPVQILVPSTPLQSEAINEARVLAYGAETVRVMGPGHLLAIMVELNRPKDRIRIALFLDQSEVDRARLGNILARWGLDAKWNKILKELGLEEG